MWAPHRAQGKPSDLVRHLKEARGVFRDDVVESVRQCALHRATLFSPWKQEAMFGACAYVVRLLLATSKRSALFSYVPEVRRPRPRVFLVACRVNASMCTSHCEAEEHGETSALYLAKAGGMDRGSRSVGCALIETARPRVLFAAAHSATVRDILDTDRVR